MAKVRMDSPELHGIQILRAVAALAVIIHHTLEQSKGATGRFSPNWFTTLGASGVDIFFVISGFIMLYVSFYSDRAPPTAKDFLFRRATRIYPIYWLCCLLMLLISAAGFLVSQHHGPWDILASFLLLPGGQLIGVSWTLVYEVYFYLIFALTLWLGSARVTIIATTTAIIFFYLLAAAMPAGGVARFLANPLPGEFCMGLGLAYAYSAFARRRQSWPMTPSVIIPGLALMAMAAIFVAHPSTAGLPPVPRVAAWGIPAVLMVAGCLNLRAPRSTTGRFWILLGNASYSLYLTHVFVMIGYGRLIKIAAFSRLPQWPVVLIIVLFAIAVGVATHLIVEKPLLGLIRRLTRRPAHAISLVAIGSPPAPLSVRS